MRLGFDVDGIFADFNVNYVKLFPQCHFPPLGDNFPDVWYYPEKYGATEDAVSIVWGYIKSSGTFWRDLPHYPGVLEVLERIRILSCQHQVYFITSRVGSTAKWQTEEWLSRRGITCPTVLVVSNAEDQKPNLMAGLQLNAYIDDKLDTMEACVGHNLVTRYFLFTRPWNRDQRTAGRWLTRVTSVNQMLDQIGV